MSRKEDKIEIAIKARDKDGKALYQVAISNFDREDLKEIPKSARWEKIKINRKVSLIFTTSTKVTSFTDIGERVCLLLFSDGRRVRLYPGEITDRDFRKILKEIRAQFVHRNEHDPRNVNVATNTV